jgi:GT2 family glycosyltransferase
MCHLHKNYEYTLIVPYHSSLSFLRLCLESIEKTVPPDVERLLVINNSSPEVPPWIPSSFRCFTIASNLGYSAAINVGAREARGKHLIFCDADTFYFGDWFHCLTRFFKATQRVGMASSKLVDPGSGLVSDYGIGFTKYNAPHPFIDNHPNVAFLKEPRRVQAACSANMIIERKIFEELGMFDEELLNFYADIDLCLRINEMGLECWVIPDSVVFHRGNSAQSNRSAYRADVKGAFMGKNSHRFFPDMDIYFRESLSSFGAERCLRTKGHLLVDLTTIVDKAWHYDLFKQYIDLKSFYEYGVRDRDNLHIALIDLLGFNLSSSAIPIIYFVDRSLSLRLNKLWLILRERQDDLVIDRNANITTLAQLVK